MCSFTFEWDTLIEENAPLYVLHNRHVDKGNCDICFSYKIFLSRLRLYISKNDCTYGHIIRLGTKCKFEIVGAVCKSNAKLQLQKYFI